MRDRVMRIVVTLLEILLAIAVSEVIIDNIAKEQLEPIAKGISVACASIMVIVVIIGVRTMVKAQKECEEEVDIGRDDLETKEYRERAEKDYEREKKRIQRIANWGSVYFSFIYLVIFVGLVSSFLLSVEESFLLTFSYLYFIFSYGLNGMVCLRLDVYEDCTRIKQKEYPYITNIVKEVFLECGIKGRVKFCMNHENRLGVARSTGVNHVMIGAKAVALYDEEELRQTFFHEAAHIKNKDTYLAYRLQKKYDKWNEFSGSLWGLTGIVPVYICCYLYSKEFWMFMETSSHMVEVRADKYAAAFGNSQVIINGLAKVEAYDCYEDEYVGDGRYYYLRKEKLEKGMYSELINTFKEQLPKMEGVWRERMENRLLENTSSHPTFSERKNIMGIEDFQICFGENDPRYKVERKKLLDQAEQEVYDSLEPEYEVMREEYYLAPMAKISSYKAGELGTDILTKIEIAALCEDICRFDDAYALYEEIRKEDPVNATAAYGIGRIKLLKKDSSGIKDLYDSLENQNETEEKLELIGEYCVEMGLAKEYEHWKRCKNDILNYYYNRYLKIAACWDEEILSASDLGHELIERRKREILEMGQGMISKIYLVKKQLDEDCRTDAFLLKPKEEFEPEFWEALMERVCLLLDNDGEENIQYGLHCLWEEPELEKIVSKVEGTCIFQE